MPVKTIECALADYGSEHWRAMPADRLLSIAAVLGPDFTSLWLALTRQGAYAFGRADDAPLAGEIVAEWAGDFASFTAIVADGVVTPEEKPTLLAIAGRKPARAAHMMRLVPT